MKVIFLVIIGLLVACHAAQNARSIESETPECHLKSVTMPTDWITMRDTCKNSMRQQIQTEVNASLQYLALAAHFSRDVINRPGFAKFFFEAASEEREHALKLIEYLLMRGELTTHVTDLLMNKSTPSEDKEAIRNGVAALEAALKLETQVTKNIRQVIINCETGNDYNDYHLVDYLTGEFLEEQYKGQRDLAGKVSTLKKMMDRHGAIGEFIFDKKLLGMDI